MGQSFSVSLIAVFRLYHHAISTTFLSNTCLFRSKTNHASLCYYFGTASVKVGPQSDEDEEWGFNQ